MKAILEGKKSGKGAKRNEVVKDSIFGYWDQGLGYYIIWIPGKSGSSSSSSSSA